MRAPVTILVVLFASSTLAGCKKKANAKECDALLERFSELVVRERFPDAGAAQRKGEQDREKVEARGDDNFKNCTSEVQAEELACAMAAANSEALKKCLE